MFALISDAPHEDGILLGTELVAEHLGIGRRDGDWLSIVVDKSVGGLCPF